MPNNFVEQPDSGFLMIASGFDPVLRWDSQKAQAVTAGIVKPATAPVIARSGTGSITGTYSAFLRFVDDLGNVSNLSPISNEIKITKAASIDYSAVATTTDPKVVKRQLLRNTNGQYDTFYLDVETTDLEATTFSSALTDALLVTNLDVPLLDVEGRVLANRNAPPPNNKTVMAHHLGRMFYTGEEDYLQGSCQVTFGSTTVTGIGTEWTSSMAGRFLYVVGGSKGYEIDSVGSATSLTLLEAYEDPTDKFGVYAIRAAPAEKKLVYWSEAGKPESVSAFNSMSLEEDGDDITALMPMEGVLYILERRHIYTFRFKNNPALDGLVFAATARGVINQRCLIVAEGVGYMLDEQGIHAYGGGENQPVSTVVQDLFRDEDNDFQINWKASKFFHACHFPQQETIRWFVAMGSSYLPKHAIALNYRLRRWWIEEFSVPIGASCTGMLNGRPQVFLGADAGRILAFWKGTLDGPDPGTGRVQGTMTAATLDSFTDSQATFPGAGVVGNPVMIVDGLGKGQTRIVRTVSGTKVTVTQPWLVLPDTTSVYQLGGIKWSFKTGWFRWAGWAAREELTERRLEVQFQPLRQAALMNVKVFQDTSEDAVAWEGAFTTEGDGVRIEDGKDEMVVDLTRTSGFAQRQIPGSKDNYLDGPRYVQVELGGVANQEAVKVFSLQIDGAK